MLTAGEHVITSARTRARPRTHGRGVGALRSRRARPSAAVTAIEKVSLPTRADRATVCLSGRVQRGLIQDPVDRADGDVDQGRDLGMLRKFADPLLHLLRVAICAYSHSGCRRRVHFAEVAVEHQPLPQQHPLDVPVMNSVESRLGVRMKLIE